MFLSISAAAAGNLTAASSVVESSWNRVLSKSPNCLFKSTRTNFALSDNDFKVAIYKWHNAVINKRWGTTWLHNHDRSLSLGPCRGRKGWLDRLTWWSHPDNKWQFSVKMLLRFDSQSYRYWSYHGYSLFSLKFGESGCVDGELASLVHFLAYYITWWDKKSYACTSSPHLKRIDRGAHKLQFLLVSLKV